MLPTNISKNTVFWKRKYMIQIVLEVKQNFFTSFSIFERYSEIAYERTQYLHILNHVSLIRHILVSILMGYSNIGITRM